MEPLDFNFKKNAAYISVLNNSFLIRLIIPLKQSFLAQMLKLTTTGNDAYEAPCDVSSNIAQA